MKLRKKILLMITAIIATTLVALGVYVTSAFNFSTNELAKTFKDYNTSDSEAIKQTKPISILLMGVDTGDSERKSTWQGNSDSMILVTINPETKTTTMTSLERDVLVTLSGPKDNDMTGVQAKLNTAYASGGAKMAIMTVQDLLDIEIDNYIQINMQGLVDLVDAVGGITVTNNFDFPISIAEKEPEYTATVEPGTHKINGEQALVYARMRYDDPEGDYGRQKRQREVIQKVMKKILALDSVSSYKKILSAVSGNMQTNIEISSSTIPSFLGYTDALSNVETYQLQGEGEMINGTSYAIVSADHLLEIQNNIKKQLGQKRKRHSENNGGAFRRLTTYDSSYSSGYDTTYSDGYNSNYYYDDYSSSTYSDYYGSTDTYSQSYNSYSY